MRVLALDSSGIVASVAVVEDDTLVAEYTVNYKKTHSQTLLPMLDEIVKMTDLDLKTIDAIAVAKGPGSFTGLRIGIGAVKGLAMGAQKPCIGISTLEALAQNLFGIQGIICAVMDARCNQVYTASFTMKCGELSRVTADEACSIDTLQKGLRGYIEPITLVGDGAALCYEKLKKHIPAIQIAAPENRLQRAASVAACAYRRAGEAIDAAALTPLYLRLPQAERERLARQQKPEEQLNGK